MPTVVRRAACSGCTGGVKVGNRAIIIEANYSRADAAHNLHELVRRFDPLGWWGGERIVGPRVSRVSPPQILADVEIRSAPEPGKVPCDLNGTVRR